MKLSRICAITVGLILLASLTAESALAQTGVVAFRDDCTGLLYAMHADGSGRMAIPLPPKPEPASQYRYQQPMVLDMTTSGPLTVVWRRRLRIPTERVLKSGPAGVGNSSSAGSGDVWAQTTQTE